MAKQMRGYNEAQARQIFRDLIDIQPMSQLSIGTPQSISATGPIYQLS
jgi:hypothetical protein